MVPFWHREPVGADTGEEHTSRMPALARAAQEGQTMTKRSPAVAGYRAARLPEDLPG